MSKSLISPLRMFDTLVRYGRVFATVGKSYLFGLVALSALAALFEGIGISMFFPLLNPQGLESHSSSNVARLVHGIFSLFGNQITVSTTLMLMLFFFVSKGIVRMHETKLRGKLVADFHAHSQQRIFEKICSLRFDRFQSRNRGALTNLLSTETQNAAQALIDYSQTISCLATATAYSLLAVTLSWRLAMAGVICGLIMLLIQRPISNRISKGGYQLAKIRKELGSEIFETFTHFKYLRASNALPFYSKKIDAFFKDFRKKRIEMSNLDGIWVAINQPLSVLVLVSLIYWDSSVNGTSVLGSLVSLGIIYRVMGALNGLLNLWNNFSLNRGHLDFMLQEEKNLECDAEAHALHVPGISWEQPFRAVDLSLQFGPENSILSNVSLEINHGDFIAIVGPSGSGKSTLLDILIGLYRDHSGLLYFNNERISNATLDSLRHEIGFVGQDVAIFNGTILQNIVMQNARDPIDHEWVSTCVKNSEMTFVQQMPQGLETIVGEGGLALSGGQKQRLGLAREMYKRPKILFLDEATSALDTTNEDKIINHLAQLSCNMKIVLVTHRLAALQKTTKIYVLDRGKTVESGSFKQLSKNPQSFLFKLLKDDSGPDSSALRFVPNATVAIWADMMTNGNTAYRFRIANISETGIGLYLSQESPIEKLSPGSLLDLALGSDSEKVLTVARVIHLANGILGLRFVDVGNSDLKQFISQVFDLDSAA